MPEDGPTGGPNPERRLSSVEIERLPEPDPQSRTVEAILDLTGDEVVIDLTEPDPDRPVSGRPASLFDNHRVVTINGGDLWMAAEAFVYDLYRPIGYCVESDRHRVEELARWSERSRFHAVIDDDDAVIGTVRNIFGNYAELPVGLFERTDYENPDPVCEFSSLTVHPALRSTGVIEHLYRSAWLDAFRSGSTTVVALIDEWLFDVFVETYRLPFKRIGVGAPYMGSHPFPVSLRLDGPSYLPLARDNPEFWAWTLEALEPEEIKAWGLPVLTDGQVIMPRPAAETSGR